MNSRTKAQSQEEAKEGGKMSGMEEVCSDLSRGHRAPGGEFRK